VGLLGLLLIVDLGRANQPWILWWNYVDKYSSNPIIDLLRDKPYEHRVAMLSYSGPPQVQTLPQLYRIEWSQHAYPYYNIQSLDIVQLPREPEDLVAFTRAFGSENVEERPRLARRRWELTNTRFLLGLAESEDGINNEIDPEQRRIRMAKRFRLTAKPGVMQVTRLDEITAELDPAGPYALYEFGGALPRAKFYENWEVRTNGAAVLEELGSRSFEPTRRLIVDAQGAPGSGATNTNDSSAAVEFVRYSPRDIVLKSVQSKAGVLLLNDRYDPNWSVRVDGRPEKLLRCNYLMRGVYLQPGSHIVEFRFQPPFKLIYVSLAALLLGVVLLGAVIATGRLRPLKAESATSRNNKFGPLSAKAAEKRAQLMTAKTGK
jgi:hypothetical protein